MYLEISPFEHICICQTFALLKSVCQHKFLICKCWSSLHVVSRASVLNHRRDCVAPCTPTCLAPHALPGLRPCLCVFPPSSLPVPPSLLWPMPPFCSSRPKSAPFRENPEPLRYSPNSLSILLVAYPSHRLVSVRDGTPPISLTKKDPFFGVNNLESIPLLLLLSVPPWTRHVTAQPHPSNFRW